MTISFPGETKNGQVKNQKQLHEIKLKAGNKAFKIPLKLK